MWVARRSPQVEPQSPVSFWLPSAAGITTFAFFALAAFTVDGECLRGARRRYDILRPSSAHLDTRCYFTQVKEKDRMSSAFLAFIAALGFSLGGKEPRRNLFYGNIVGAAGGFIVGLVVSIRMSCCHQSGAERAPKVPSRQTSNRPLCCLVRSSSLPSLSAELRRHPNRINAITAGFCPNRQPRADVDLGKTVLDQSDKDAKP